jgi:serine O-acetyltransferase
VSRSRWRDVLADDLRAMGLPAAWRPRYRITHRLAFFVYLLRRAESRRGANGILARAGYAVARWRYERYAERMGIDIPLGVFGPGLSIAHRGTIVVNGETRVGRNCRVHPGLVIGGDKGRSPVIGDDVFLGPNVSIIGGVSIGEGAVIAAHALVIRDVPPGALALAPAADVRPGAGGSWVMSRGALGPRVRFDEEEVHA